MTPKDMIARSHDLVFAEVDGEAVALSAAQGTCYGLDTIGLRVLQLIDPPATVSDICRRLTAEYEVDAATCETDTINLLKELEIEGLVVVEQGKPA
jgi:hypothetical protein